LELFEGPVVAAVESSFVAEQQGQALLVVGHLLKNPGQTFVVAYLRVLLVDVFGAVQELEAEQVGFEGAEAAQAPAGDGHGFDQVGLNIG
jgi:hypothetical protein